jgi:uncharacterized membrane protein YedE/YeeE
MKTRVWFELAALVSGLIFALGLGVSGMARPAKVLAFLDVTGAWDPSLAFVMAGAIGVHGTFVWLTRAREAPVLAPRFARPAGRTIDTALVFGSALFGVGWGLVGYCPGPAVVAAASLSATPLLFCVSMLAGLYLAPLLSANREEDPSKQSPTRVGASSRPAPTQSENLRQKVPTAPTP